MAVQHLLLSADHHLRQYAAFNHQTGDGIGTRLRELLDVEDFLLDTAKKYSCPHIILGDFLDEKEQTSGVVAAEAGKLIRKYSQANIDLWLLVGNHESAAGGVRSTLEVFSEIPGATVVFSPLEYKFHGLQFVFLPHHEDLAVQNTWVQDIAAWPKSAPLNVLGGHIMLDGAKTGSEYAVKGKFSPSNFGYQWDLQLFGHVHEPQEYYVGSMAQRSWADEGSNRRAILLSWDTKNPKEGIRQKAIPLPGPVFRTVKWEEFDQFISIDKDIPKYYRIQSLDYKQIPYIREKAQCLSGFTIESPHEAAPRKTRARTEGGWHEIIRDYVHTLVPDEVLADDLIDLGLELFGKEKKI